MRIQDLSPHLRQLIDGGFQRLIQTQGGLPNFPITVSLSDSLSLAAQATQVPVGQAQVAQNYWVDAVKGSDANGFGTVDKPYQTIGAAVARIGLMVNGPTQINIASGTYAETLDLNFLFSGINAWVSLVGAPLSLATLATGIRTGTFDVSFGSPATPITATVAGAGWTAHDLRGKFVQITSGGFAGQVWPIADNTATSLELPFRPDGGGGSNDIRGATFSIVTTSVTLTGDQSQDTIVRVNTLSTGQLIGAPSPFAFTQQGVTFSNVAFVMAGNISWGMMPGTGASIGLESCTFSSTTNDAVGVALFHGGVVLVTSDVYFDLGVSGGANAIETFEQGLDGSIALINTVINGGHVHLHEVQGCLVQFVTFNVVSQNSNGGFAGGGGLMVLAQGTLMIRNQPYGFEVFDNTQILVGSDGSNSYYFNNLSLAAVYCRSVSGFASGSHNLIELNGATITNCVTGIMTQGSYSLIDISGSTISGCTTGVNLSMDARASHNSLITSPATVMSGNTNDFFTGAGNLSLSALRAAPSKTVLEATKTFNRLVEF